MRLYRPVDQWRARGTFLMVLCAAALGMGSWWRFSYLLGSNGGAPFMLAYVLALLLLAVPLLVAELVVGRIGRRSPLLSVAWVTALSGRSELWVVASVLGLVCALCIAALSILLGAWALAYAVDQQLGHFAAISLIDAGAHFEALLASPNRVAGWQAVGVGSLVLAGAAGLKRGVAIATWLAVPLLAVVLAVLLEFALLEGGLAKLSDYLFAVQLLDFDARSLALAFSQALFTLAAGAAAGISLGAAASDDVPLLRSALAVAVLDCVFAVAVGIVVFALCFAVNLQPQQGPSLLFIGLPYAFGNVALGDFHGALFYFALFLGCMSLALVMLEPLVSVFAQQLRMRRLQAVLFTYGLAWLLAVLAAHSVAPSAGSGEFLSSLTAFAANLLPAGALILSLFVGWRVPRKLLRRELHREPDFLFSLWYFALRFAVPPSILLAWVGLRELP